MLSFTLLDHDNAEELSARAYDLIPDCDGEYLNDIINTLLDESGEVALTYSDGCLLARAFDGEYSFVFPLALTDDADAAEALDKLRLYAMKEEIPLVLTDVPRDELGWVIAKFRHATADATDADAECYSLRLLTEAALLDSIPTLDFGGLTLDALTEADDSLYARLSKDGETNKFWGYDYREDTDEPSDEYFRLEAESEFSRGASMSFAVRQGGKFIGEATLYAFDYHGGCELAIRLLPEYRRLGVAGKIIEGFFKYGQSLGLINISAQVMKDNIPSVGLCKKYFENYSLINVKTYKFTQDI